MKILLQISSNVTSKVGEKKVSLKSSVAVDDNVKASKKEREIKGKDVDKERKLELSPQPLLRFCVYVRVSLVKCEVSYPLYNIWQ